MNQVHTDKVASSVWTTGSAFSGRCERRYGRMVLLSSESTTSSGGKVLSMIEFMVLQWVIVTCRALQAACSRDDDGDRAVILRNDDASETQAADE